MVCCADCFINGLFFNQCFSINESIIQSIRFKFRDPIPCWLVGLLVVRRLFCAHGPMALFVVKNWKCSILLSKLSAIIALRTCLRRLLCRKFASFFTQRAEHFVILRRKPVEGYDISFLITNTHLEARVRRLTQVSWSTYCHILHFRFCVSIIRDISCVSMQLACVAWTSSMVSGLILPYFAVRHLFNC